MTTIDDRLTVGTLNGLLRELKESREKNGEPRFPDHFESVARACVTEIALEFDIRVHFSSPLEGLELDGELEIPEAAKLSFWKLTSLIARLEGRRGKPTPYSQTANQMFARQFVLAHIKKMGEESPTENSVFEPAASAKLYRRLSQVYTLPELPHNMTVKQATQIVLDLFAAEGNRL